MPFHVIGRESVQSTIHVRSPYTQKTFARREILYQRRGVDERLAEELAVDPDLEIVAALAGDGERGILDLKLDGAELFFGGELTLGLGEGLAGVGIDILGNELVGAFGLGELGVKRHRAVGRKLLGMDFIEDADERYLASCGIFDRHVAHQCGDEHRLGLA